MWRADAVWQIANPPTGYGALAVAVGDEKRRREREKDARSGREFGCVLLLNGGRWEEVGGIL